MDGQELWRYKAGMNNSTQHVDAAGRKMRTQRPERFQIQWRDASLDQIIPDDHRVRAVWAYVESLDLKPVEAVSFWSGCTVCGIALGNLNKMLSCFIQG
jgi:hypothetical protein